jgi:hypothetical protein
MATALKYSVPDNRFIGLLFLAPIATSLVIVALGAMYWAIHPILVMLFPTAKYGLDEAIAVLPIAMLVAGFSTILGAPQYLLFGGAALWLHLQTHPVRPWTCAVILLAINCTVTSVMFWFGYSEFGQLCLIFGSFFAPLWGFVFGLLYRRSIAREAKAVT